MTAIDNRESEIRDFVKRVCDNVVPDMEVEEVSEKYFDQTYRPSDSEVRNCFLDELNRMGVMEMYNASDQDWNVFENDHCRQWLIDAHRKVERDEKGVGAFILPPRSLNIKKVLQQMKDWNQPTDLNRVFDLEVLGSFVYGELIRRVSKGELSFPFPRRIPQL